MVEASSQSLAASVRSESGYPLQTASERLYFKMSLTSTTGMRELLERGGRRVLVIDLYFSYILMYCIIHFDVYNKFKTQLIHLT